MEKREIIKLGWGNGKKYGEKGYNPVIRFDPLHENYGRAEFDICPTCGEHCGDEGEECDACGGTGIDPNAKIQVTSRHYIVTESRTHPNMYIFKNRKSNAYFLMESYPEYVLAMQE